jgi:hypothetical protein
VGGVMMTIVKLIIQMALENPSWGTRESSGPTSGVFSRDASVFVSPRVLHYALLPSPAFEPI